MIKTEQLVKYCTEIDKFYSVNNIYIIVGNDKRNIIIRTIYIDSTTYLPFYYKKIPLRVTS